MPDRQAPSSLYRAWTWRFGLWLARVCPAPVLNGVAWLAAELYYRANRRRREIVRRNVLPIVNHDLKQAGIIARRVFHQFARKLTDLWRYEGGRPVDDWFSETREWERFQRVYDRRQGMLVVTPHLGNWELGGPLLARRGVKLLVITQAEPDDGFTEMRMASRAKWGIETLVIGQDSFAIVEVIKRLQEGATVALLLDRPPPPTAVTVELFGLPFQASIAPAELARASGCALLGVTVVRTASGYTASVLPEFEYDRRALCNREARRQLTQQILRAFEPEIRQHPDQWYHFVSIWPEPGGANGNSADAKP